MGALGNMNKNISPKARMMLGLTIVGVVGIVGVTLVRLGGDSQAESAGIADLNLPPTKEQISKDRPTDKVIFGEGTVVGEIYKKEEEHRAEEAIKTNSSHVDAIKITKLEETVEEKEVEEVEVVIQRQPSYLEQLMQERREAKEKTESQNQAQVAQGGRANLAIQENPWKQFLDDELRSANDFETSLSIKIASFKSVANTIPAALYEEGSEQAGKGASDNGRSTSGATGYERFLTNLDGPSAKKPEQESRSTASRTSRDSLDEDNEDENSVGDYPSDRIAKSTRSSNMVSGTVDVGEMHYSVLQIGINTDEISPVRAVIVDKGKLEGAVLVGNPARTGEKASIEFTNMNLKGKSYKIKAIALDPETNRSGLADGVDNHVISRYSKLALAAFVDGYANALSSTQSITNTDGSTSTITNPLPDATSQVKIGVGKVGEKMTPIFEKEFERPPTITVEPNKSIVVMFMDGIDLSSKQ